MCENMFHNEICVFFVGIGFAEVHLECFFWFERECRVGTSWSRRTGEKPRFAGFLKITARGLSLEIISTLLSGVGVVLGVRLSESGLLKCD